MLKSRGVHCYRNQVAKIMRHYGLRPKTKRKYKLTTDSKRSKNIAQNLIQRNFQFEAINKRREVTGVIFHSNRGSQYASDEFVKYLAKKMTASMSRKGDCWDNAVAESFFKTLKSELVYWNNFKSGA